ncbi:MAG: hemin uptake protein HemP, partial [Burkholderiales bacterium]
ARTRSPSKFLADDNKNNYHSFMIPSSPGPRDPSSDASGSGPSSAQTQDARPAVRRVASGELFGNTTELVIVHGQREYRLRVTSNGKLILTA